MAVGQFGQLVATFGQKVRRPALGNHQRQHLTQRQAPRRHALRVGSGRGQDLVDLGKIGAVPDPQALRHAMHFTMAGHRRERHAVEVVTHDALAGLEGLRAPLVGAHAGGNHLADFLAARHGEAVGRVTVFFQLGGQGAAAGGLAGQGQVLGHLAVGCLGKAWPVHRRVGVGIIGVEQVTVLDEQQAVDDHRRDRVEVRVQVLRVVVLVEHVTLAVGDRQAGLDLFLVGHEEAVLGVVHQCWRKMHLLTDYIIALEQAWQEIAQGAVAQALVERPVAGVDDRIAGPRLQGVGQGRGELAQFA
ncbi:hypothetical protein D3C77_50610 [compost metagenome]